MTTDPLDDTDLATLREQLRHLGPWRGAVGDEALDRVETELARLREERDAIGAALGEPCAECGHIEWRSDGYADNLTAPLKESLRRGVDVAAQYLDTGRGDLDGWIESVRALLADTPDGAA